ncbi:hypothetical protein C0993_005389 [Termitomyces sp. T159_Od127]|nr:hypothetical protein C0993_005389 [Termitomyces sp. T159_Od127]
MQSAKTQTPARRIQVIPSPSIRRLYWTPEMQAVTRDSKVGKRALAHRFYKKFDVRTCAITNKSSTTAPALMVEFAHMKPHSDTGDTDNIPIVNIYVHRLLDAHLVTFVLDKSIIKIIEEKLRVNFSAKTVTEKRQRILTVRSL